MILAGLFVSLSLPTLSLRPVPTLFSLLAWFLASFSCQPSLRCVCSPTRPEQTLRVSRHVPPLGVLRAGVIHHSERDARVGVIRPFKGTGEPVDI